MINGISTRVAFKALGSDGLGIAVSGYISDQNNVRMSEFQSEHAGMGSFKMKPSASNTYTAYITFKDGSEKAIPLPKVKSQGYVLTADNMDPNELKIRISTTELDQPDSELTLVAQTNGQVQFVSKNKMNSRTFNARANNPSHR